jgi:hypothetical protein
MLMIDEATAITSRASVTLMMGADLGDTRDRYHHGLPGSGPDGDGATAGRRHVHRRR